MTKSVTSFDDHSFLLLVEDVMGLAVDESLDDFSKTSFTSDQERRIAAVAFRMKVSTLVDEEPDDLMVAMLASNDERSRIAADGVDRRLVINEDPDDVRVAQPASEREGVPTGVVLQDQNVFSEQGQEKADDLQVTSFAGCHEGCRSVLVLGTSAWERKVLDDVLDGLQITMETGHHQTVVPVVVFEVEDGFVLRQIPKCLRAASLASLHEGRLIHTVLGVDISSTFHETLDDPDVVLETGDHEGCEAFAVSHVWVHPVTNEDIYDARVSSMARHLQTVATKDTVIEIVGSSGDEEGDYRRVAHETRDHERGEPVPIWKVDGRACCQKDLGDGSMAVIAGGVEGGGALGIEEVGVISLRQEKVH